MAPRDGDAPTNEKQLAKKKWKESGLSDAEAKRLELCGMSAAAVMKEHPSFQPRAALYIPYFDFEGEISDKGFYRIRYLSDPLGFAGLVDKPQKYAQKPGTQNEIYLPPLLVDENGDPLTWAQVAEDRNTSLIITEGELKAAAACANGYYCIGLGGVEVWSSKAHSIKVLPQLREIDWTGRDVYIVFDSDAATNPNVLGAQLRLSRALQNVQAVVKVVNLPPPTAEQEGLTKQGLDDYLKTFSTEKFDELLANATPLEVAEHLCTLNAEVAYVWANDTIVRVGDGKKMSPHTFVTSAYAPRKYKVVRGEGTENEKTVEKSAAKAWLEWPARRELDDMCYEPGKLRICDNKFNEWQAWGCSPKKGEMKPWHELMEYVFQGNKEMRRWFEQWAAYPIQYPGTKLLNCCLMWGQSQGTGKTLVGEMLGAIYGDNYNQIKNSDLHSGNNDWAQRKQFILGDEITSSGDRRAEGEAIKKLITQKLITINEKYVKRFTIRDCINYYFTSNHSDAFLIEDTDRRYFIWEFPDTPMTDAFYDVCDRWLKGDGPSALFYYLLNDVNVSTFNPNAKPPVTMAKMDMIRNNKSDLGMWVRDLKDDPTSTLMGSERTNMRIAENAELLTVEQLISIFDPAGEKKVQTRQMVKALKESGFKQACHKWAVRTGKYEGAAKQRRLYAIRNIDKWVDAPQKEAAEHWNEVFVLAQPKHKGGGK